MTWLRIDDSFVDDPKLVVLSDAAHRAVLRSWGYAAKHETDGHLPAPIAKEYTRGKKAILDEILEQGLWKLNGGSGYVIHNFNKRNPTKAELAKHRAVVADRQKRWRETHRDEAGKFHA
ncbi:MAG: hypothetical protein H0X39_00090 [Actinobacteria bacterium]|nr:hypothetical protein [Actinomycetota bacterium]